MMWEYFNHKISFTPEGRKLEYSFAMDMQEEIKKLDGSKEEKESIIRMCWDYLIEYERQYFILHKKDSVREEDFSRLN